MERRGSGFRKILLAYRGHDDYTEGMDPTFTTPWDSFVLTLPKINIEGVEGVEIINDEDVETNDGQGGQTGGQKSSERPLKNPERILQLIKQKPTISAAEIAKELNMSSRGIEKQIKKLREAGILKREGADFDDYWKIIK